MEHLQLFYLALQPPFPAPRDVDVVDGHLDLVDHGLVGEQLVAEEAEDLGLFRRVEAEELLVADPGRHLERGILVQQRQVLLISLHVGWVLFVLRVGRSDAVEDLDLKKRKLETNLFLIKIHPKSVPRAGPGLR